MQNAVIMMAPRIAVRAERVAEVLGINIERANALLSQPDTRDIIQAGLERSFQETVDAVLRGMTRVPTVAVPAPRVDCVVDLPLLPVMRAEVG